MRVAGTLALFTIPDGWWACEQGAARALRRTSGGSFMPTRIISTLILALAAAIAMVAMPRPGAAASGYMLSEPVSHENLSVYFVRGAASKAPVPLTLQEASTNGQVRIREMSTGTPLLDNLSGRPIFVPFGTLLTGGLQDQVISSSLFVGPGATGISLPVFCVERGRSVKREGDAETAFTVSDALIPSRVAKLALLSGASHSRATDYVRQIGVWLTIASMKQGFAGQLDTPIESARAATSLPLALAHPGVSVVESPYVEALASAAPAANDVIGAVFAINGRLSSAEIYGSHALFQKMWPSLLRAYAGEAGIARGLPTTELPSRAAALAFVINGERAVTHAARTATAVRVDTLAPFAKAENESGVFAATRSATRGWSHKSYVAKAEAGATPMEATVLRVLSDSLADTGFSGRAWSTLELVQQLTTWLAQMSEDPETAMQQAGAARIVEPRPAAPAYEAALGELASVAAYPTLDDRSSNTKMLLLTLALFAVLGRLAIPVLVRGMRRLRVAIQEVAVRVHAGWALLGRAVRHWTTHAAAKTMTVLMLPRMRTRYALAVAR